MRTFISVDVGTTNTKASLVNEAGKVLAQHAVMHVMKTTVSGWSEHDMEQNWWGDGVECIRRVLAESAIDPASVQSVMLSGMSPSIGITDENGKPLRMGITQSDIRRPKGRLEDFGLTPWDHVGVNTYLLPHLLWVKENEPEVFAGIRKVFFAHSYLCYRLTGHYCIDFNTSCWMTPLFDREKRCYVREAFDAMGLDKCEMPEVYSPLEIAGSLTDEAAAATGLTKATRVLVGTGDFYLSQMASGLRNAGDAVLYFGTVGTLLACAEPAVSFLTKPSQVGRKGDPVLMGPIFPVSGVLLEWFSENFAKQECEEAKTAGMSPLQYLDKQAEKIPIGSNKLIFLPHLNGERTPDNDPFARGVLYGLDLNHKVPHVYRAIMESFCLSVRHALEGMEAEGKMIPVKKLAVGGGGAKSPLWRQMTSDCLGVPQSYVSGADETFAGAYVAAMAVGIFENEEAFYRDWLSNAIETTPIPENVAQYNHVYEVYKNTYHALKGSYSKLQSF
ncbi:MULTISPECIES: FGGY-family carbohydrate kinase [Anaerotruncus]|uniref:FGGY-family carbohydrate kinase n=2 Tax=Oscillospiraceae TaxID=216572 RepID=UPI000E4C158A|nr:MULTISPECIES: FGGY family carbohydrate kinase [Anaerotruncus]RGX54961.1 hypothetical protein DWV16_11245 [Anaerotruncus sp. AF02-27]